MLAARRANARTAANGRMTAPTNAVANVRRVVAGVAASAPPRLASDVMTAGGTVTTTATTTVTIDARTAATTIA